MDPFIQSYRCLTKWELQMMRAFVPANTDQRAAIDYLLANPHTLVRPTSYVGHGWYNNRLRQNNER